MKAPSHGTVARRQSQRQETALAMGGAILGESAVTLGLAFWPGGAILWLLLHLAISAALIWWLRGLPRRRRALRYPALLTVSVVTLGLVGAVGAAFASLAQRAYRSEARSFQTWYYTLFPPRTQRKARTWYDLSRALGDEGSGAVESFADLIRFGDIDQKLAIVALLARRFEPRFAPVLQAALQDQDASVRVQAATASAHIEDAFVARWVAARRQADARRNDAGAIAELARLLDDYAFAGILDERREAELRVEAEAAYREALDRDPEDPAIRLGLGRLLIRSGRHEDALEALAPMAESPSPDAAAWLMEALFRLGRYAELRRLSARLPAGALPERLESAASLWRGAPPDDVYREAAA